LNPYFKNGGKGIPENEEEEEEEKRNFFFFFKIYIYILYYMYKHYINVYTLLYDLYT